jgi:hypothetical protein
MFPGCTLETMLGSTPGGRSLVAMSRSPPADLEPQTCNCALSVEPEQLPFTAFYGDAHVPGPPA